MFALLLIIAWAFKTIDITIPKTWDIDAIKKSHLPPPDPSVEVQYAPEEYYNSLPEHVIYKTYPRYAQTGQPLSGPREIMHLILDLKEVLHCCFS